MFSRCSIYFMASFCQLYCHYFNEMMVVANGYSDVCIWPMLGVFVSPVFALQTFALSSASISNTLESRAEVLHQQVAKNEQIVYRLTFSSFLYLLPG